MSKKYPNTPKMIVECILSEPYYLSSRTAEEVQVPFAEFLKQYIGKAATVWNSHCPAGSEQTHILEAVNRRSVKLHNYAVNFPLPWADSAIGHFLILFEYDRYFLEIRVTLLDNDVDDPTEFVMQFDLLPEHVELYQ